MDTIQAPHRTLLTLAASLFAGAAAGYAAGLGTAQPQELPIPATPALEARPGARADDSRLERIEAALRGLELARGAQPVAAERTAPGTAELTQQATSAPVTAQDVQRFYELERAVARHRALLGRQERAKHSVARMLDEAKVEGQPREAVNATLTAYFASEQRLVLQDKTTMDDMQRSQLERQREALRDQTRLDLVRAGLEPGVAQAVTDQLWLGKAPGIPVRAPQGLQGLQAGEVTLAPGAQVPGHGGIAR